MKRLALGSIFLALGTSACPSTTIREDAPTSPPDASMTADAGVDARAPDASNTNVSCLTAPACISAQAWRPGLGSRKIENGTRVTKSVAF